MIDPKIIYFKEDSNESMVRNYNIWNENKNKIFIDRYISTSISSFQKNHTILGILINF